MRHLPYLMSCSPQSTQKPSLFCLLCACTNSLQRLIATAPFTASPHRGQNRTGALERRWFKLGQMAAFMAGSLLLGCPPGLLP